MKLTILHTNDLHGRVPQLTRIAALVRQIRREVEAAGGYCLYVDAGDLGRHHPAGKQSHQGRIHERDLARRGL